MGDGWFGVRSVHLATIDEDWALYFLKVLKEWSTINPTLTVKKNIPYSDLFQVNLYSRFVMEFLKDNKPTNFVEFLKGFFDAEGSFCFSKKDHKIRLYNTNLMLLQEIKGFLSEKGIKSYIYRTHSKEYPNRFSAKPCYALEITNNKGVFWFYKNIGFRIGRKQERLEEWWRGYDG